MTIGEKILELSSLSSATMLEHFGAMVSGNTIINVFEPIDVEYIETEAPIIEYIKDPEMEIEYIESDGEIIEFITPAVIEVEIIPSEQINIDYDA